MMPRRAEGDEEEGFSILGNMAAADREETEEAQKVEEEMQAEEEEAGILEDQTFNEDDLTSGITVAEQTEEEASRSGSRQVVYNLAPSNQYVLYIAKKNAERNWTKDGPDGVNKGCLEVQIAILTERIRNMVLHVREFNKDFLCRWKIVKLVARRRRYLDKLSWKDLDSYVKIRDALKIRHVYRLEALIGRLPAYKYAIKDRKRFPGRKIAMRLKKSRRLLSRRLADQKKAGRAKMTIHKTQKKINARKWGANAYDTTEFIISGKPPQEYVNPLEVP
jgi:small subunit ribosomal protein S15